MVKYDVVTAISEGDLADRVEAKLEDGWSLAGGVSVVMLPRQSYHEFMFFQAVVKYSSCGAITLEAEHSASVS